MLGWAGGRGAPRRLLARLFAGGLALGLVFAGSSAVQAATNIDAEIVYLDPAGVIRVLDPRPISPVLAVTWASPEGGWTRIAVGDFNADGDAEIAAIRPEEDGGRLTIYDPVMTQVPAGHGRFIDGIAWDVLYSEPLPGEPRVVVSGNFDTGRPGHEILVSHFLPEGERSREDDRSRVFVLRQVSGSTDGHTWERMTLYETEPEWMWGDSGNADGAGADEVVLVDNRTGTLSLFRVGESLESFFTNVNTGSSWQAAALGQFEAGGPEELAAVRDAELPLPAFWVFRYADNDMEDALWEAFLPSPDRIFFADLTNNGDEEVVMLRQVRQEAGARPRLIIRDNGNDTLALREALLDGDNGYRSGAGGDMDGDGRDEIVLIRDSRIRIYTEPEASSRFEEIRTPTNSLEVRTGNVDANGLGPAPRLGAMQTEIVETLRPGARGTPVEIRVWDVMTGAGFLASVRSEGGSEWVTVAPASGSLPLTLTITLDSSNLNPGSYRERILVDVPGTTPAVAPLAIQIHLTVESGVTTSPETVVFVYYPCVDDLEVRSLPLLVDGPIRLSYSAEIEGNPAWADVTPLTGEFPDTLTVTVYPELRASDLARADLLLRFDLLDAPGIVQRVPVVLLCAKAQLHLPFMADAP